MPFADPGFLGGGPRLPLGSVDEIAAAWDVCEDPESGYDQAQLGRVRAAVVAAASRLRVELSPGVAGRQVQAAFQAAEERGAALKGVGREQL